MIKLFSLFVVITACLGHPGYRLLMPNGINVPNPCINVFGLWNAVGHNIEIGGGAPNQFGKDFDKGGGKWTAALCRMDSDQDGKTNGEELGDPNCTWTPGSEPSGDATGHPGICEPMYTDSCMKINVNITCV